MQEETSRVASIATVLVPLPLPAPLSYAVPSHLSVEEGSFVSVPVGRKQYHGVVWKVENAASAPQNSQKNFTLKPISDVFPIPPMGPVLRQFIDWVARYNVAYPGMVLKMVIGTKDIFKPAPVEYGYGLLPPSAGVALTSARKKVIAYLKEHSHARQADILEATSVSASVLKAMVDANMLQKHPLEVTGEAFARTDYKAQLVALGKEQQYAADQVVNALEAHRFVPFLLDGVTGSGKTEVFFAAVAKVLESSTGQALILLPEIALTTQMIQRITERFGVEPTQWHSGLTPAKRRDNWLAVAHGNARLVVGARSALFLPFRSLSCIVVDEEHDPSYKQEEGVIYHARDMAVVYASLLHIPIILASATPSLETVLNAKEGKYTHLVLPSRYGGATLPEIKIIDMRRSGLTKQQWISPDLLTALKTNMAAGNQSLLFINRRGYAPLLLCRNCGYRFQCDSCSSWLVAHKNDNKLHCHHCGYERPIPEACPECQAEGELAACGPGAERIAEEVEILLPDARVLLLTSDHLTTPKKMEEALDKITSGQVDIIVGTQLMAKGHHFPKLTLVGVVDADLGLSGGDLRAAERTFQLLHQVAGRAGREQQQGHVLLQSYIPDNAIIQALKVGDKDAFLQAEEESRSYTNSPPFMRYTALVLSGKKDLEVKKIAMQAAVMLRSNPAVEVLGPVPAPLFLLRGKYRYRLLLKTERSFKIQTLLLQIREEMKKFHHISLKIDIDPHSFV